MLFDVYHTALNEKVHVRRRGEEIFCLVTDTEDLTVSILSVGIDEEAGEGAVFVGVPPMNFASVQLHTNFIPHVQVQDDAVGGVVVVLICILCDCTGPHLRQKPERDSDAAMKE